MVYKAANIRTGNLVAFKHIQATGLKDPTKLLSFLRQEVEMMKSESHPNVAHLDGVIPRMHGIYLFEELFEKESLEEVLRWRKKLPETEVMAIAKQIASGYKYLFKHQILHLDLKPSKIMIKD